ncbi:MAG: hypothetical protein HFE45_09345 [Oscillospiraceae bacterium]|nr:hypothetical protein [Oscillospiraceae bacterium]
MGLDAEEYPYFLLSAQQMIDKKGNLCLLHFSDCVNNGGTSQLFIDFSPSANGQKGQVLRHPHDLDELLIIADSSNMYCLWETSMILQMKTG